MVEDAARLYNIEDKIAKRTEEIICYAECEKSVQICVSAHFCLLEFILTLWVYVIDLAWAILCQGN